MWVRISGAVAGLEFCNELGCDSCGLPVGGFVSSTATLHSVELQGVTDPCAPRGGPIGHRLTVRGVMRAELLGLLTDGMREVQTLLRGPEGLRSALGFFVWEAIGYSGA